MSSNVFVTTLSPEVFERFRDDLLEQGFTLSVSAYTLFQAKKPGVSCTLYESGKLVVQGGDMRSFIEFYLEPQILKTVEYTYGALAHNIDASGRIGVDESGKGDFFGPLCIAAVFAEGKTIEKLISLGVKDSKTLSDKQIHTLAHEIKEICKHSIVAISPTTYNELYKKFRNLNSLLAWGHATAIQNLSQMSGCTSVIIDQFAHESVVRKAIEKKGLTLKLKQRHRGEEDIVVAAASILARDAFVEGLQHLSKEVGRVLPKGASASVIQAAINVVEKHGREILAKISKQHFSTTQKI